MMSREETQLLGEVYRHMLKSEEDGWTDLDDNMEFFDWLTDPELVAEAEIKRQIHARRGIRCPVDHPGQPCHGPIVLDAVSAILRLHTESERPESVELHIKNRYILLNFIAMSEMGLLINES